MEQAAAVINALSFLIFLTALVIILIRTAGGAISTDTGIFLSLTAIAIMFVNVSNVLEHLGITAALDYYEDYVEMLVPLFVVIALNSIRLHADIERLGRSERDLSAMLDERNELLKEIHHRVKNNLQVVISLVDLRRRQPDIDEKLDKVLMVTENRIYSMSAVHETIYQASAYSSIPAGGFIRTIATQASQCFRGGGNGGITLRYSIDEEITVPLEVAVPLGLIVNELVSNALRHAFDGRDRGAITVTLARDGAMVSLEVRDNGIGMEPPGNESSLGTVLVQNLAGQIHGTVATTVNGGTAISVRFPQ